ncbi:MAG: histidine phosphatase family protein [Alphaproteobacteria bacterium]|nr:histidine phosphatase family protein [Alphaproteobacteria bacterium]
MSGLTGIKVIMARVTLIRHGKAETSKLGVQDFDRPLISRGQINASAVGAILATHRMLPQLVLVSPSARTRETYDFIKPHWPDEIAVQFVDQLYEASASTLLQAIIDYGGDLSDIAVIGHNPSLVVLLNHMVGDGHAEQNLGYFPTCCMADIGFVAPKIRDLVSDGGRLLSIKRARDL